VDAKAALYLDEFSYGRCANGHNKVQRLDAHIAQFGVHFIPVNAAGQSNLQDILDRPTSQQACSEKYAGPIAQ
jgi:hypothetical protein